MKDGRLELTFEAKGMIEVMRWILAWGSHCTVKAPVALKKMVHREIQAMGNRLTQPSEAGTKAKRTYTE